jgi:hypothetical protein
MLIKEICVIWFTWVLKIFFKSFNLRNWILVLVKDFWTLTPIFFKNKSNMLKTLLIKKNWWEKNQNDDNLWYASTFENIHNLKILVLEILEIQNIILECSTLKSHLLM